MIDVRRQLGEIDKNDLKWRIRDLSNHKDLFYGTKEECIKKLNEYKKQKKNCSFDKFFGSITFLK